MFSFKKIVLKVNGSFKKFWSNQHCLCANNVWDIMDFKDIFTTASAVYEMLLMRCYFCHCRWQRNAETAVRDTVDTKSDVSQTLLMLLPSCPRTADTWSFFLIYLRIKKLNLKNVGYDSWVHIGWIHEKSCAENLVRLSL